MTTTASRFIRLISCVALLQLVTPAFGLILMTTSDTTIKGDSLVTGYQGSIGITSFSFGASNSGISAGGGGGAGKVSFQDLNLTKSLDTSSTALLLNCASGKHLAKVTLYFLTTPGGADAPVQFYDIVLEDVLVSSISTSGGEDERPSESVSLNFGRITVFYYPIDDKGKPGKPTISGWDIVQNKSYVGPNPAISNP